MAFLHLNALPTKLSRTQRLGFTLIELLIVIAIVGVLLTVVVINMGSAASMTVSMATQDSLRIVRHARNMALQTQQPINVLFTHGRIEVIPTEIRSLTPEIKQNNEFSNIKNESDEKNNPIAVKDPNRLEAGAFDDIGLVKYYQNVNFKFISYNDNLTMRHTKRNEHNAFERRINIDKSPETIDETGQASFTLTINANGTMRPCSILVYACDEEGDTDSESGNTVSFDFLCTGTIANE